MDQVIVVDPLGQLFYLFVDAEIQREWVKHQPVMPEKIVHLDLSDILVGDLLRFDFSQLVDYPQFTDV